MPIFEKQKIIFIHIPRTSGTSFGSMYDSNYHFCKNNLNRPYNHNTFLDYENSLKEKINNYNIISIVRNPYDRIFSFFKFHLDRPTNLCKIKNMIINEKTNLNKFNLYLYLLLDKKILSRFNKPYLGSKTQTSFLLNKNNLIDSKIEIIHFDDLKNKFPNLPHLNSSVACVNKQEIFTNENIKIINNYFDEDFINFNYHKL